MSVIAGQSPSPSSNETTYIVAVKGAPETLKSMVGFKKEKFFFFCTVLFKQKWIYEG